MTVFDEIAEKTGDDKWDEWKEQVLNAKDEIAEFVGHRLSASGGEVIEWFQGSFNFCLRVTFQDRELDAIIRFPAPGHTTFADEKIANEVQVINFLQERTTIPVARLLSWGLTKDSPKNFGPFIISDFISGIHLSDILRDPASRQRLYLDPDVDNDMLHKIFYQLCDILLQLYQFDFPAIGAISKDHESNIWAVTGRPLTYTMNELATAAYYPVQKFSNTPFHSSSDYFKSLSRQHITHLWTQRNLTPTPKEAEEQYIARHLFAILSDKYAIKNDGPFKLFCDDFRPQNILIDPVTHRIIAVLDLEFTNAMPSQYASESPWWLLLAGPDSYLIRGRTIKDFLTDYEPRLEQFLQVMQQVEVEKEVQHEKRLSGLMRESWTTRRFWFNYASRKPFDVKELFNSCLNDDRAGIECLDAEAQAGLGAFVKTKMEQLEAYDNDCRLLL